MYYFIVNPNARSGYGLRIWNRLEKYLMLKSEPEYYNDTVCTFGYFRGNHTVRYVNDVFDTYNKYLGNVAAKSEKNADSPPATNDQQ